jgi:hypothetical protein
LYDFPDEVLADMIREARAKRADLETRYENLAVGPDEREDRCIALNARDADRRLEQAPTHPIPPGARRDEIFADVVHDGSKKIERWPNPWSKGEVLDYLLDESLEKLAAPAPARRAPPLSSGRLAQPAPR